MDEKVNKTDLGHTMGKDTNKDGQTRPKKNIFELIQMVADNPQLSIVTEDGMIKISALECSRERLNA